MTDHDADPSTTEQVEAGASGICRWCWRPSGEHDESWDGCDYSDAGLVIHSQADEIERLRAVLEHIKHRGTLSINQQLRECMEAFGLEDVHPLVLEMYLVTWF